MGQDKNQSKFLLPHSFSTTPPIIWQHFLYDPHYKRQDTSIWYLLLSVSKSISEALQVGGFKYNTSSVNITFIRINYMYMQLLFDWPICWLFFHDYHYISLWLIVLNLLYLYKKCCEDKMWLMLFTHHSYKTPS